MKSSSVRKNAASAMIPCEEEFELNTARGVRRLALKIKNFLKHHGFFDHSLQKTEAKPGESHSTQKKADGAQPLARENQEENLNSVVGHFTS